MIPSFFPPLRLPARFSVVTCFSRQTHPGWKRRGPAPLCPAAPQRCPAGAGGTDALSPGPGGHRVAGAPVRGFPRVSDSFQCGTYLHAPGGVPQTSVRPHLDGSVAQLLRQLQHPRVVGNGLIEVPLRVVRAAQVAVRPRLLAPIL